MHKCWALFKSYLLRAHNSKVSEIKQVRQKFGMAEQGSSSGMKVCGHWKQVQVTSEDYSLLL